MYSLYDFLSLVIKFTIFLNFVNVVYDIVSFFTTEETQTVTVVRMIISTSMNVISGFCSILNSIHNSESLEEISFLTIVKRFKKESIKEKSNRIIMALEKIVVNRESAEYRDFMNFREAIRVNLLTRISMSELFHMILSLFFYFSITIDIILYSGNFELNAFGKKGIFLFFNVISPLFCCFISYVIILYDNINSIEYYIEKVGLEINTRAPQGTLLIGSYCEKVKNPILPF